MARQKLVEVMFANESFIDSESLLLEGPESDPASLCGLRLHANLPLSASELGSRSKGLSLESGFRFDRLEAPGNLEHPCGSPTR